MIAFEPLGFYEEFFVKDAAGEYRFAGVLECPDPAPRKLCAEGTEECVLTEPVTLRRGMKVNVVKASTKRPVEARTRVYPLCGRVIRSKAP